MSKNITSTSVEQNPRQPTLKRFVNWLLEEPAIEKENKKLSRHDKIGVAAVGLVVGGIVAVTGWTFYESSLPKRQEVITVDKSTEAHPAGLLAPAVEVATVLGISYYAIHTAFMRQRDAENEESSDA